MRRVADLEAQVAALTAENQALKTSGNGHAGAQPDPEKLADAIGVRLTRVEQNLKDDFIGKFAGNFLLALETITKRVADAEGRQTEIERKLVTHKAEIAKMLDGAIEEQRAVLRRFNAAVKQHHEQNEATLAAQQEAVEACGHAAQVTAEAAATCVNFKQDYEETVANAKLAMTEARSQVGQDLGEFTRGLKEKSEAAVEPAMRQLRNLSDSQMAWRIKWTILGFLTCVAVSVAVLWLVSPAPYVMLDAARWRNWQADNFTRQQADRLNAVLNEIEQENAKKAGEGQR